MNLHSKRTRKSLVVSMILALSATTLPLATSSCNTPGGRNAAGGAVGGALLGGLIGGGRGAAIGALSGGIIGAATTPSYSHGYYPQRPPRGSYGYY